MFPKRTKWLRRPIGWQDLGKHDKWVEKLGDDLVIMTLSHTLCGTRVSIGKENLELFRYCPRCLIKITPSK